MSAVMQHMVQIQVGDVRLEGDLSIPPSAQGIVIFAHGSGSSRFSPRNRLVAEYLQQGGLATLLLDLLEEWESDDRRKVFDIDLLAERLIGATAWAASNDETRDLAIGYFGASTGAAAALEAAAKWGDEVKAVVSRGGRPDLAMPYLPEVKSAVLLIVGGNDWPVISMNEEAFESLTGVKDMKIVPGATHLFEEPGTLEEVARLAREWFKQYLTSEL